MQKKGVYRILYRDAVRASGLWLSIVLGIRVRIYSDYNPNCIICCYKTLPDKQAVCRRHICHTALYSNNFWIYRIEAEQL